MHDEDRLVQALADKWNVAVFPKEEQVSMVRRVEAIARYFDAFAAVEVHGAISAGESVGVQDFIGI